MLQITKADGTREDYQEDKIRASASRVGVRGDLQEAMLKEIRAHLYDGIKTSEIYDTIRSYLSNHDAPHLSTKYNLKAALAELGPSGYPFEKFLAALLTAKGYDCKTNQVLQGGCVTHEVDVLAVKDETTWFVEAKFHRSPTQPTDVRVTLYIHSRYLDLSAASPAKTLPWIITNTRFTSDAVSYANCQNIPLTSWSYPRGDGLVDWIEATGLHPITMLDGLQVEDKRRLLAEGVVTCQQFITSPRVSTLLPRDRYQDVLALARRVCAAS